MAEGLHRGVTVIGGGPAGLYSAILLRKLSSRPPVTLFDLRKRDDHPGFGVVFPARTLALLEAADAESAAALRRCMATWTAFDVFVGSEGMRVNSDAFCAIRRGALLETLARRARDLGVELRYEHEIIPGRSLELESGLVVAADGGRSTVRNRYPDRFGTSTRSGSAKFLWLGTSRRFEVFNFLFARTPLGVFQAHAYPYDERSSAFVVECDEASWRSAGFAGKNLGDTLGELESMFAPWLLGARLIAHGEPRQPAAWSSFLCVKNRRWTDENVVLAGDAAHTTHFSIGSGTTLAFEDAVALARAFESGTDLPGALAQYSAARGPVIAKMQRIAERSMRFFETVPERLDQPLQRFTAGLLTRGFRPPPGPEVRVV